MFTLIDNNITKNYINNLTPKKIVKPETIIDLFNQCVLDFQRNTDNYYVNMDINRVKFIDNINKSITDNSLFEYWLNKFSLLNFNSLANIIELVHELFNGEYQDKIGKSLLSILMPHGEYNHLKLVSNFGNKFIGNLQINDELYNTIETLQIYHAEGTVNELIKFAQNVLINGSDSKIDILLERYTVENAQFVESIQAKIKNFVELNEILNFHEVSSSLILNNHYMLDDDLYSVYDLFTNQEIDFINFCKNNITFSDDLSLLTKIESNNDLNLLKLI